MRNKEIRIITTTGVFAALILLTTFLFHIPIGASGGYIHLGDGLVYLSSVILPMPFAMLASAIGGGLSDFMTPGGMIWIIPTIIIKPLCCLPFTQKSDKFFCRRNIFAVFIAGLITIAGYFVAAVLITGGISAAIAEIPFQAIQAIGSAIFFLIIAAALDKNKFKKFLLDRF